MKRLLILILALVVGAPATSAQGLPRALALTVSVNTNGVVVAPTNFWSANSNSIVALTGGGGGGAGGGTNYLFDTNSFFLVGTNVFLAPTQYLSAERVLQGGGLIVRGGTLHATNSPWINLVGTNVTLDARSSFKIYTPGIYASTSMNGHVLSLVDDSDGTAEFTSIDNLLSSTGETLLRVWLRMWAASGAYTLTSAARDSDGVITSASVSWPDGSSGTFTTVSKNTTFLTIDAFTISHAASGKTVTQNLITRDGDGLIIAQPALTVTP